MPELSRNIHPQAARTAALVALLLSAVSLTEVPSVRFLYQRGPGAEQCPDEQAVRNAVAVRLGYDALRPQALRSAEARVERAEHGLVARIALRDASGAPLGEREVSAAHFDCAELAEAMVLALSIAIDPLGTGKKQAEAPPPALPPPPRVVEQSEPIAWQASAGLLASAGFEPRPSFGVALEARVRGRLLSLGLEGRADLPVSVAVTGGTVSASLLAASVVPCLHRGGFSGCAVATGGALRVAGHRLPDARSLAGSFFAVGGRLLWELPLSEPLWLRLGFDFSVPLVHTVISLDEQVVWESPPVAAAAGAAAVVRF
ncbi:MAG: hypothetical protein ACYC8T_21695 [Myxococcaceae bacterium]